MDFLFFEKLAPTEAVEYLKAFLDVERQAVIEMISAAKEDGIEPDFSVGSIPTVCEWAINKMRTLPRQPDETLPSWITKCESYTRGLFDFDEPSRVLILRVAYYFGESFVRYSGALRWSTGNPATAEGNMPVIAGFKSSLELAPILITENLARRIRADGAGISTIELAVDSWIRETPSSRPGR
jgi:hypothetical protein